MHRYTIRKICVLTCTFRTISPSMKMCFNSRKERKTRMQVGLFIIYIVILYTVYVTNEWRGTSRKRLKRYWYCNNATCRICEKVFWFSNWSRTWIWKIPMQKDDDEQCIFNIFLPVSSHAFATYTVSEKQWIIPRAFSFSFSNKFLELQSISIEGEIVLQKHRSTWSKWIEFPFEFFSHSHIFSTCTCTDRNH